MGNSAAPISSMPRCIRIASVLTLILAAYAAAISVPGIIAGLFVGPHLLIAAVVHALFAPVLIVSLTGLLRRKRWARWLLLVLSAIMALGLPIAIVRDWKAGNIDVGTAIPWLLISLAFGLIALNLSDFNAIAWFTGDGYRLVSTVPERDTHF